MEMVYDQCIASGWNLKCDLPANSKTMSNVYAKLMISSIDMLLIVINGERLRCKISTPVCRVDRGARPVDPIFTAARPQGHNYTNDDF